LLKDIEAVSWEALVDEAARARAARRGEVHNADTRGDAPGRRPRTAPRSRRL
jgi:hypothetical protein